MRSFFKEWPRLRDRFRRSRHRLLLFDFDGTLAPIARLPSQARLGAKIRRMLSALSRQARTSVGIVSGRSLRNVKGRVRVKGLIYVGNHGLEVDVRGKSREISGVRRCVPRLRLLARSLRRSLVGEDGTRVENKGITLSVHYRNAPRSRESAIIRRIKQVVRESLGAGQLNARRGKKVIEIVPKIRWDKGMAVRQLAGDMPQGTLILYVGDDVTDESVFRRLRSHAVTIRVGRSSGSRASYFVTRQTQMQDVLIKLLAHTLEKGDSYGTRRR